jgi:hypothetical protein
MGIPFRSEVVSTPNLQLPILVQGSEKAPSVDEECGSADRSCVGCDACCIHLPIVAGEVQPDAKPAGVVCPHLTADGCRIYGERPHACRRFQCAWLADPTWPLAWRPDRSGLLCLCEEIDHGVSASLVYEIQNDAISRSTTEPVLEKLKESSSLIALVNQQRQRRLLRGYWRVGDGDHGVRRPHFLKPIGSGAGPKSVNLSKGA